MESFQKFSLCRDRLDRRPILIPFGLLAEIGSCKLYSPNSLGLRFLFHSTHGLPLLSVWMAWRVLYIYTQWYIAQHEFADTYMAPYM